MGQLFHIGPDNWSGDSTGALACTGATHNQWQRSFDCGILFMTLHDIVWFAIPGALCDKRLNGAQRYNWSYFAYSRYLDSHNVNTLTHGELYVCDIILHHIWPFIWVGGGTSICHFHLKTWQFYIGVHMYFVPITQSHEIKSVCIITIWNTYIWIYLPWLSLAVLGTWVECYSSTLKNISNSS